MPRPLICLFTSASALALVACTPIEGSKDGNVTDQEKRSFELAQGMVASGDLAQAQSIYQQLAAHPESAVQADLALAQIDRKLGQNEDAVDVMRAAQKQEPGNPAVLTQLGYALIAAGHPEDAVNVFDELIAMSPGNVSAYNAKAVAFDKAGNHVAAQEIYQKALSLAPGSQAVRNNLAMSYILNDQPNDAINLLEPMVKQQTSNATMRQNLALAYGIKGDKERAMQLNLQDVPPDQAKENMRFYEKYAQAKREHASVDLEGRMQQVIMPDSSEGHGKPAIIKKGKAAKPMHPIAEQEPSPSEPVSIEDQHDAYHPLQPVQVTPEAPVQAEQPSPFSALGHVDYDYPNKH